MSDNRSVVDKNSSTEEQRRYFQVGERWSCKNANVRHGWFRAEWRRQISSTQKRFLELLRGQVFRFGPYAFFLKSVLLFLRYKLFSLLIIPCISVNVRQWELRAYEMMVTEKVSEHKKGIVFSPIYNINSSYMPRIYINTLCSMTILYLYVIKLEKKTQVLKLRSELTMELCCVVDMPCSANHLWVWVIGRPYDGLHEAFTHQHQVLIRYILVYLSMVAFLQDFPQQKLILWFPWQAREKHNWNWKEIVP